VDKAFSYVCVDLEWQGEGPNELGVVRSSTWSHLAPGTVLVQVDPRYFRPTEVEALQADITKAKTKLGWAPRVTLEELVKVMVDCDVASVGLEAPGEGLKATRRKGFDYTNHDFSIYEQIREH